MPEGSGRSGAEGERGAGQAASRRAGTTATLDAGRRPSRSGTSPEERETTMAHESSGAIYTAAGANLAIAVDQQGDQKGVEVDFAAVAEGEARIGRTLRPLEADEEQPAADAVILGRTIPGYVVNLAILGFAVAAEGYSCPERRRSRLRGRSRRGSAHRPDVAPA
jgi:hypothetical protein